jgi:hypothetical protein
MSLVPADPAQCQCEITTHRPFVMGGRVNQTVRCDRKPVVIATEKFNNEEDGLVGSMSLCTRCLIEFLKAQDLEKFILTDVP